MTTEQQTIYNFLGQLSQAFKDNDQAVLGTHILTTGIAYCSKAYHKDGGMTKEELAHTIASKYKAHLDEMEAFKAKLDKEYPTMG